jgi:hypothetical protein
MILDSRDSLVGSKSLRIFVYVFWLFVSVNILGLILLGNYITAIWAYLSIVWSAVALKLMEDNR